MRSRYDYMTESRVAVDPEDGLPYPDPLSVNYAKTQLTEIPKYAEVTQSDIERFWFFMYQYYDGLEDLDDILLQLNNIPYIGTLTPGDRIYLVTLSDLLNFNSQKQPG